jgi:hypothetical protein
MKDNRKEKGYKVNCYICDTCGKSIVTVEYDDGVTPFFLGCNRVSLFGDCNGLCRASMYSNPQNLIPTALWYRKKDDEPMNPGERQHHENGGLFFRELTEEEIIGYVKKVFYKG